MFEFFHKKKPPLFWSSRQLVLSYQLLCRADEREFKIRDLLFAWQYPLSITTSDWEAFRTMFCLSHLEKLGIEFKQVLVNPNLLELPHFFTSLQDVTTTVLYQHLQTKSDQQKLLRLSRKEWLKLIDGELTDQLAPDGSGPLPLSDEGLASRHILALILSDFSCWQGKIAKNTLKKAITNYLKEFKQKTLIHPTGSYFSYPFCKRVLKVFLKKLSFRQGKHMHLQLGNVARKQVRDEFMNVFKESFPEEYLLWRQGSYVFPFFESLLCLELEDKIIIEQLRSITEPTQPLHQQQSQQLHYYGAHRQALRASIELRFPEPKRKQPASNDQITEIQIVKSTSNTFYVCLNDNRINPLILNKSSNSGHLLYTLAVNNGWANYDRFASGLQYIQKDKRFKLFAKTHFSRQPLLEVDDGYIIPVSHLSIRLVDQL